MKFRHRSWVVSLLLGAAVSSSSGGAPETTATPATSSPSAPGSDAARSPVDLGPMLAAACEKSSIPGVAALVLRGDTIVARGVIGVRKAGEPTPIGIDDRFHLGSDTKAMTATLLASLVEEGRLRWSTTVGEIFASKVPDMHPQWKAVTLDQLLTHRGGAPGTFDSGLWLQLRQGRETPPEQRLELARGVLSRSPASTPGTRYIYSNAGYALAGAMAEIVTGRPWEELLQTRVFTPLGITSAGFGAPGTPGMTEQPLGHTANGKFVPVGPLADNPPAIGPAGTVHMNISDWSRFIALHLRGDAANPNRQVRLLKADSFVHLHTPMPDDDSGYIAGWLVVERPWAKGTRPENRGTVLTHSGSNTMWLCTVWIAPERDFAVLVTCNQGGEAATTLCDDIVSELVKKLDEFPSPAQSH